MTALSMGALLARELRAVEREFPELATALADCDGGVEERRAAMFDLIAITHPSAREAALRTRLRRAGGAAARREIAESDLREGIPYSVAVQAFPDIWERALPEVRCHEEAYGAAVFTQTWPSLSRGKALVYYFHENPVCGRVLHVAPEPELEAHFRAAHGVDYETLGLGANTDLAEDLTELMIEDETYDLIVCHRVLEHIFDEAAALSELLRVLRPGGVLNVSVPESMHLPEALEWRYPDASHHNHYRQYGADFAGRLRAAGFEAECEDWLLAKPGDSLRQAGVYPLRMYNGVRGE